MIYKRMALILASVTALLFVVDQSLSNFVSGPPCTTVIFVLLAGIVAGISSHVEQKIIR